MCDCRAGTNRRNREITLCARVWERIKKKVMKEQDITVCGIVVLEDHDVVRVSYDTIVMTVFGHYTRSQREECVFNHEVGDTRDIDIGYIKKQFSGFRIANISADMSLSFKDFFWHAFGKLPATTGILVHVGFVGGTKIGRVVKRISLSLSERESREQGIQFIPGDHVDHCSSVEPF